MEALPTGPLTCIFKHGLSSLDLVHCASVCKHWHQALADSPSPWHVALAREHGYAGPESAGAKQQLIAARTGVGVWAWGGNVLGLGRMGRFTTPEQILLHCQPPAAGAEEGARQLGPPGAAGHNSSTLVMPVAARDRQPAESCANVRAVDAAADFAAMLTWDGAVLDSRTLGSRAQQQAVQAQQQQRQLEVPQLWRPPGSAIVQVAVGGCWQGPSSKEGGGHVLALAADGRLWGWGCNHHGQLGLGSSAQWVSAPAEVLDVSAAAALGEGLVHLSCGDAHSGLLLRSGAVALAGSNSQGECGLGEGVKSAPVFCLAVLPPGMCASRLSCGGRNSAVVTTDGRLLVCGDDAFGQCGGGGGSNGGRGSGYCFELSCMGPDASWHGMPRMNQRAEGGGGQAAAQVVEVCCGSGSMYAITDGGELFAWGQGGQGELGLGGSCKNTSSPAKLPWARDIVSVHASAGGRFTAAVDSHSRLFTFGAGKFGQLGHGDTNKKAVGRPVKALQHLSVRSVACGGDFMLGLACWKQPAGGSRGSAGQQGGGKGQGRVGGKQGATTTAAAAAGSPTAGRALRTLAAGQHAGRAPGEEQGEQAAEGSQAEDETPPPSPSFHYVQVEPGSPSGSGHPRRRRQGLLAALLADPLLPGPVLPYASDSPGEAETPRSSYSSLPPDTPSTSASLPSFGTSPSPHSWGAGRRRSSAAGSLARSSEDGTGWGGGNGASGSGGGGGGRRSGGKGKKGGDGGGGRRRWEMPDPEGVVERRRRWMAEPPAGGAHCSGGEEEEEGGGAGAGAGADRRLRYLIRRQLKVFASSPQQRELAFPASLSSYDRYKVHCMAEAWGLMHQSVGEGSERHLLVWKPSRSRKTLKPGMGQQGAAARGSGGERESGDRAEASGSSRGGEGAEGCLAADDSSRMQQPACPADASRTGQEQGGLACGVEEAGGAVVGKEAEAGAAVPGREAGAGEGAEGSGDGELEEEDVLYTLAADSVV